MNAFFFRQPAPLHVTPYEHSHATAIRDLIANDDHAHLHLDWQTIDSWLDQARGITRVAVRGSVRAHRVAGLMAASLPLHGSSWLRLAGVAQREPITPVLDALWEALRPVLTEAGIRQLAWLFVRDWPDIYAAQMGFKYLETVITLRRAGQDVPAIVRPPGVTLIPVAVTDVPTLATLDQAAFMPPWQMSADDVAAAHRVTAYSTLALIDDSIVGYQMSSVYFDGGHLARLAVHPAWQGRGIGRALVVDLLRYFAGRGIHSVTVNTQKANIASQAVYTGLGFRRNGFDLPVWTYML